jgi:hypothetical protein
MDNRCGLPPTSIVLVDEVEFEVEGGVEAEGGVDFEVEGGVAGDVDVESSELSPHAADSAVTATTVIRNITRTRCNARIILLSRSRDESKHT